MDQQQQQSSPGPTSRLARTHSAESDAHSSLGQHSNSGSASTGAGGGNAHGHAPCGADERSASQGSHNAGGSNPGHSPMTTPRQSFNAGAGTVPAFPGAAALPPPWPGAGVHHAPSHSPQHGTPMSSASASANYASAGTVASSGSNGAGMGNNPHMPPPPPQLMNLAGPGPRGLFPAQQAGASQPQLGLSMTRSGETASIFSGGSAVSTPRGEAGMTTPARNARAVAESARTAAPGSVASASASDPRHEYPANTPAKTVASEADKSVLLGLEELERQQADLEERRATEELRRRFDVEARKMNSSTGVVEMQSGRQGGGHGGGGGPQGGAAAGSGLPPLPPRPTSAPGSGQYNNHGAAHAQGQYQHGGHHDPRGHPGGHVQGAGPHGHLGHPLSDVSHSPVPDHIHLTENDEDTILTSDQLGEQRTLASDDGGPDGGGGGDRTADEESMRRVKSIDRLRDTVSGVSFLGTLFNFDGGDRALVLNSHTKNDFLLQNRTDLCNLCALIPRNLQRRRTLDCESDCI